MERSRRRSRGQLVQLEWKGTSVGRGWGSHRLLPYPLFRELTDERALNERVFQGLFARHPAGLYLGTGGAPEKVNAEVVSGSLFAALGVGAAMGRVLDESDDQHPGAHPVVVLSHDY